MKSKYFDIKKAILLTCVLFWGNYVISQHVYQIANMKTLYLIDTITIESPYLVGYREMSDNNFYGATMILDKFCLDVSYKLHMSYNETNKYCGYPFLGFDSFNSLMLNNYYSEKEKYLVNYFLYDLDKLYEIDTNYKSSPTFYTKKYKNNVTQFYLMLISVEEYNRRSSTIIQIQSSGYILVVTPILTDEIKQQIKYTEKELKLMEEEFNKH
jgi:hypothetical protein